MYCLIGARDGTIYIYDPLQVTGSRIISYNQDDNMPFYKNKTPEIVKWIEPVGNENPTKFVVVYDDGSIYIYDKDITHNAKEDYTKAIIQTNSNNGKKDGKDGKNFATKSDIILKMQDLVENFDFQKMYKGEKN